MDENASAGVLTCVVDDSLVANFRRDVGNYEDLRNADTTFYAWPSDTDRIGTEARVSHLQSDVVLFACPGPDVLSAMYLAWNQSCGKRLARYQIKPRAVICGGPAIDEDIFALQCMQSDNFGDTDPSTLITGAFRDADYAHLNPIALPSSLLLKALMTGRAIRRSRGQLWTRADRCRIQVSFRNHSAEALFNYMDSLTLVHEFLDRVEDVLITDVFKGKLWSCSAPLVASYLAVHAVTSPYWRNKTAAYTEQDSKFAVQHFTHRYRLWLNTRFGVAQPRDEAASLPAKIFAEWKSLLQTPAEVRSRHILRLRNHADFLQMRQFKFTCCTCLAAHWTALLPCAQLHGVCDSCLRSLDSVRAKHGTAQVSSCPICLCTFEEFTIPTRSPGERGRVLALDGGGVRGLVQLEVLGMLEEEIGLGLPLIRFFDLIVGTSIGGIVALGLAQKGWTISRCKTELGNLAREVFSCPSKLSRLLSSATSGMLPVIQKALKVMWNGSIYPSKTIDSILMNSFGHSQALLSAQGCMPHIALTTASDSACQVLTTYNRNGFGKQCTYGWMQESLPLDRIKTWEAARCTSAAPWIFPKKELCGRGYLDGGLYYNWPVPIAVREGSELWACEGHENVVVSVGCGVMLPTGKRMFGGAAKGVATAVAQQFDAAAAEKEHRFRHSVGDNYCRLDPDLAIAQIDLDDVDAMLRSLSDIRQALQSDDMLRAELARAARMLLAACFFVEPAIDQKEATQATFVVASRLGAETGLIFQKWSHSCIVVNRNERIVPSQFPFQVNVDKTALSLDIELQIDGFNHPISGCPTRMDKLYRRFGHVIASNGRKRKAGNTDE